MNNLLKEQSKIMKLPINTWEEIRKKDGISVYRVYSDGNSYVLKHFEKQEDTREITNYKILSSLSILTMRVIASTDNAILLEDIDKSDVWRLGIENDLQSEAVGRAIAKWYKVLHERGNGYVKTHDNDLYNQTDVLTLENIAMAKGRTGLSDNPVWKFIEDNFDYIKSSTESIKRTLTYNDFYYTNLIVAKDLSAAFMFDYNLLGKGYVYSDIRNVTSSLSEPARTAFLREIGNFNEYEVIVDDVVSPLTSLIFACKKKSFPKWGYSELEKVQSGSLMRAVERLLMKNNINRCTIRPLNSSGVPFLHTLMNSLEIRKAIHINETSLSVWKEAYMGWQKDIDEENFIVFVNDMAVGWLKLNGLSGKEAWISMLVIAAEYQHKGIGSFVVRLSEKIVTGKGYNKLSIHTTEDNIAAQKCYEKCGYLKIKYGDCATADGAERKGYTYEKELLAE